MIALGVWHTNKTSPAKIAETRAAGIAIAEFTTMDIMDMDKTMRQGAWGVDGATLYLMPNQQVESFTCAACVAREDVDAMQ